MSLAPHVRKMGQQLADEDGMPFSAEVSKLIVDEQKRRQAAAAGKERAA